MCHDGSWESREGGPGHRLQQTPALGGRGPKVGTESTQQQTPSPTVQPRKLL